MALRRRKPDFNISGELEFEEYAPQLRAQTPRLRPDTDIIPQTFGGEKCFVLQNPTTLQFFRIREAEREVLAQLDGRTSLGTIHERLRDNFGTRAPSFRELAQFVFMLRHAGLLVPDADEEVRWSVERAAKKRRDRVKQKLSSFMYLTIPLIDPERFLNAAIPYLRWIFTLPILVAWAGAVCWGLLTFMRNMPVLAEPANSVLAPDNLMYLWLSFVLIKAFHEFGHAFAAKNQGAEVHRMGIMFLIFMPIMYVDTTPVWAFPRKWDKVLVGCAGMMVELFIATFALQAWLRLEPSTLRTILYNMIFIASVSTILFNGNPLLRYDAYYILSDLIEIPNLRQRSTQYLHYLYKRYVTGQRVPPATDTTRERIWFVCYGIAATAYRCFIVTAILLMIASKLFMVGVLLSVIVAALWIVTPFVKLLKYIFFAKETRPVRLRAVTTFLVFVGAIVYLVGGVSFSATVKTPCAVEPHERRVLRAEWPGFLSDVRVRDGEAVTEGQLLAVITNEMLDFDLGRLRYEIMGAEALYRRLETTQQAAAQAQLKRLMMLKEDLILLEERRASLTVRAPLGGQVIAPDLERVDGRFLQLGDTLFTIASLEKLRVVAVVSDEDMAAVRRTRDSVAKIKFVSAPGVTYDGTVERIRPSATHQPPPPALTSAGGGDVLLDPKSPDGSRTLLPWYRVDLVLELSDEAPHPPPVGVTGTVRFVIGRAPIGKQVWLRFRRMLSRRFLI